jgi:hypothetical protein
MLGCQQFNKEMASHAEEAKTGTNKMSLLLSLDPSVKYTTPPSIKNIPVCLACFTYLFHIILTTNTDYSPTQTLPPVLYYGQGLCSLRCAKMKVLYSL